MLAEPRDSRATLPGYGESKINHALAVGGIPYEMLVVEEYLGIALDNYVLVDFAGIETVVDELGGITVENPEAFEIEGQTFEAGTLKLDGERALLYSRFRGDNQGDFGRISRQQQVLRGLMHEVADVNLVRLVPNMFSLLSDHFRTDYGMTDLIDLANEYRTSCSADSIETETIEGDVSMEFDDLMQMDLSFVVSDPEVVAENVAWLLMQEEPAGDPDEEGTPVANARKDDDIQTISVARSILLVASRGPD
jgi:LCP family protein required for cell wall assembly